MIRIISADRSHIPAVSAIERQCFPDPWTEEGLLSELSQEGRIFLAALDPSGNAAGYIIGSDCGDFGGIDKIAVSPEYRRSGIGTALIKAFSEAASECGCLSLEVRESNSAAIALYTAFGFTKAGVRKGFYSHPAENAVVMIYNKKI